MKYCSCGKAGNTWLYVNQLFLGCRYCAKIENRPDLAKVHIVLGRWPGAMRLQLGVRCFAS